MATVPAILLSMLLPAAEPLTPTELDLAVAALEESLTRYTAIEATYSVRYDFEEGFSPRPGMVNPPSATIVWVWTDSQEYFSTTYVDAPDQANEEILFDGKKTYHSVFVVPDSPQSNRVSITPGPPRQEMMSLNYLSCLTGVRLFMRNEILMAVINKAKSEGTLSGTKMEHRWKISLGMVTANRSDSSLEVDLDSAADYRLTTIQLKNLDTGKNSQVRQWEFAIDEFQSVLDEASDQQIWFPLKGRLNLYSQIIHMDVDFVRINHAMPAEKFSWREPKVGTKVTEVTIPGGPGKTWLVGGEAAEEERLKQIVAEANSMAESERERLKSEGVNVNAAPPSSNYRWLWAFGGCVLLSSACFLSRYIRRRTA